MIPVSLGGLRKTRVELRKKVPTKRAYHLPDKHGACMTLKMRREIFLISSEAEDLSRRKKISFSKKRHQNLPSEAGEIFSKNLLGVLQVKILLHLWEPSTTFSQILPPHSTSQFLLFLTIDLFRCTSTLPRKKFPTLTRKFRTKRFSTTLTTPNRTKTDITLRSNPSNLTRKISSKT
jgi:hypothetical protein